MKSEKNRASPTDGNPVGLLGEFGLRVVSAIIMAAVAIALTWAGVWPFALLIAVCCVVLAWEWNGITGNKGAGPDMVVHAGLLFIVSILAGASQFIIAVAILAACAAAAFVMAHRAMLALGMVYIGLPAISLVTIRSDALYGWLAILFLLLVVWCADTMAYICGRSIGGPKVAPSISPKKTWSGAVGGTLFPVILGFFYAKWLGNSDPLILAAVAGGLAIISQIGDFTESALKRRAGIKDSSGLIPGHGGLLDRLDALIFAAVAAAILALIRNPAHPGKALLIWS